MKPISCNIPFLLIFSFALTLQIVQCAPLEPNATSLRVKSATLNGNLGFTVAEFSFEFPEPIYFQFPAPCPAGRCPAERQQAAIDADPCVFMPCDFTLKGSDCGRARLPQCESICAAKRNVFCPPVQDWVTLELGVESEPIAVSNRLPDVSLRVNFDQPCKALVFQVVSIYGLSNLMAIDIDQIDPSTESSCLKG